VEVGYFGHNPQFGVLTGERSDLLLHGLECGMTKKRLNSDHTGPVQAVFPGVVGAKLLRGGSGVS
jgi:hypothetical protein